MNSIFQSSRSLFRAAAFLSFGAVCLLAQTSCDRSRALGPPKAVPVSTGGMDLKLMSFNIRYETPGDLGSRAWRQRVVGAVKMIREEAPDVMGVQEALHGQAADLWASLPDYDFYGVGRDDGYRNGEYSGIFYRRDRFEADALDCGTFWLSDTPEEPGSMTWGNEIPRVVTWMKLVDRSTQRGFYVFNTHWDHRHQGSREKASKLIANRIAGRISPDLPVVLMGDFNAVENNPGVAYLTGAQPPSTGANAMWKPLVDTFQVLHPNHQARTTLHLWNASSAGARKIDHILVSTSAKVLSAAVRNKDDPVVSDHFPVTARVVFP